MCLALAESYVTKRSEPRIVARGERQLTTTFGHTAVAKGATYETFGSQDISDRAVQLARLELGDQLLACPKSDRWCDAPV
jgi:hypothetical protein